MNMDGQDKKTPPEKNKKPGIFYIDIHDLQDKRTELGTQNGKQPGFLPVG